MPDGRLLKKRMFYIDSLSEANMRCRRSREISWRRRLALLVAMLMALPISMLAVVALAPGAARAQELSPLASLAGPANDGLFLYRPGRGAAWVVRSNDNGTFN